MHRKIATSMLTDIPEKSQFCSINIVHLNQISTKKKKKKKKTYLANLRPKLFFSSIGINISISNIPITLFNKIKVKIELLDRKKEIRGRE